MEEESGTESPGAEDENEENQGIPRTITDEYYEELSAKANAVCTLLFILLFGLI